MHVGPSTSSILDSWWSPYDFPWTQHKLCFIPKIYSFMFRHFFYHHMQVMITKFAYKIYIDPYRLLLMP